MFENRDLYLIFVFLGILQKNKHKIAMKRKITFLLTVLMLLYSFTSFSQTAKAYYKTAEAFVKSNNLTDAITNYTKALEIDPNFIDAYKGRAKVFEKQSNLEFAAKDYERALAIDVKDYESFFNASRLNLLLKNYETAITFSIKALELEKKSLESYDVRINALIAIGKFDEAMEQAQKAVDIKKNYLTYYNKAHVLFLQGKFQESQNYYKLAIDDDDKKLDARLGMADAYYMQDLFDQCITTVNSVLTIDSKCKNAYIIRAKAYKKKIEYQNAINDMSKVIILYPNDENVKDIYFQRGIYYMEFNQHMMAINDFTEVISRDKNYYQAYFQRAAANEAIRAWNEAVKDYEQLSKMNLESEAAKKMLSDANKRLFELKREDEKPTIVFTSPEIMNPLELQIVQGTEQFVLKGFVKDASAIKFLEINGNRVSFLADTKKNEFEYNAVVFGKSEITVATSDVYDNVLRDTYKIIWTEKDAPVISLIQPIASDDGQIRLQKEDPTLFIEGAITDASLIKRILIDGVSASYIQDNQNPSFTATISIANKTKIKIIAEDIYGNSKEQEYLINREFAKLAEQNPMGITWVIFIENSNYTSFASLNGPVKDITMMKSALSQYQIHNIVHKKNLSKAEMEKFFSIELRDMVRKNNVNSIVVWYAGHGKFINNTGYWIPVDARRDDEFTYFNISSLKAAMQSYSTVVTHTLVITDACESGPTFYQAMRSTPEERDCGDWKATKFKSSQVFSSAGYELASDNSQFTKTFANSLTYNPNACIPIENIVSKVTSAVSKNNQQKPQFGKIDGLADENGTFFFIKK